MEITEQWIGKSAGGRVFKDARSLLKRQKVIQVTRKGGLFQGTLDIGPRPMRVSVKVLGPHEVKNHCGCMMTRRTGALCEHATALMLAGIGISFEKKQTASPEIKEKAQAPVRAVALDVSIAPAFPEKGIRAIHLRRSEVADVSTADQIFSQWLYENIGQADAAMFSLPEEKISGFYRALSNHSRIQKGCEKMSVSTSRLRPLLEIQADGANSRMRVKGKNLIPLGSTIAEWDSSENSLIVDLSETEPSTLGQWQEIKTKAFISMLSALGEMYQLPENLGGIEIREAIPEINLKISGSTRALQAQLFASYPSEVTVPLSVDKTPVNTNFPIQDGRKATLWWVRNVEYELTAVSKVMRLGFQQLDASGVLFLRGEDAVLEFLTTQLPALRGQWKVQTEEKLGRVESRVVRITPHVKIDAEKVSRVGSGEDWLSCEMNWECDGKLLDSASVRKLLMSGRRNMMLPNGKKAVVSEFDSGIIDGLMLDTDPHQEEGKYLFLAQQSAYLNCVKSYYDKGAGELKETKASIPDELVKILRSYQQEGVQWLYSRLNNEGAALLADDMGLGKTLQALVCLKLWKEKHPSIPALVVCPATLLGNWRDEIEKFTPDFSVLIMHGNKRKDYYEVMEAADVIITSYALLDRDSKYYQKIKLSAIVLDEASAIRNPDTLAAKATRKIKALARIAITGTPVENSVRDLWSIFEFLMPSYLGKREDFRLRYELPCQAEIPDLAAMQRLRWRTTPFMLRRTKSLVAKDLPPKIVSIIWCDASPLQKDHYQAILRHGAEKVADLRKQSGENASRMQMLTVLLRLRQSCCDLRLLDAQMSDRELEEVSSKLARLMELLEEAQRGGHRMLIFSQFTSMLALIREELDREDIDYCYLDGSTTDRSAVVNRFQKAEGPPVFLISLKAGGYGLTLTAADTVVLFDPWWNPAVEAQAADRIHRIGQTKPSTIYKFITRGTVEEKILRLQEKKRQVITAAIGEMQDETAPMMSGLTDTEMMSLLDF